MTELFFSSLDCTRLQKHVLLQKKQVYLPNIKNDKCSRGQKLAYSLKEKKYIKKHQKSDETVQNIEKNLKNQKCKQQKDTHPQKKKKSFQICKELSYAIKPQTIKLQKSTLSNFSQAVRLSMISCNKNYFEKDNLRSTQGTQLCRAQSTLCQSKKIAQKIAWNQETQNFSKNKAFSDCAKGNWVTNQQKRDVQINQNKFRFLTKGRSEGSLLPLGLGLKKQFSSSLQRNRTFFGQIQEQQQERSPTLNETDQRHSDSNLSSGSRNLLKPQMIESFIQINFFEQKKAFDQMEIRSTYSITEQSSGDDMSVVISSSELTLNKRSFSLAENYFSQFQ